MVLVVSVPAWHRLDGSGKLQATSSEKELCALGKTRCQRKCNVGVVNLSQAVDVEAT